MSKTANNYLLLILSDGQLLATEAEKLGLKQAQLNKE
jgi:hypothetical protein